MNWFQDCNTPEEVKKRWRELCFIHHPDVGGRLETMQEINAQYHALLKNMDGFKTTTEETGKSYTYHYNQETEEEVMDKITELLRLHMPGVNILLVGRWIWIRGNTKPYRKSLSALGCIWHKKRVMWYWRKKTARRSHRHPGSFSDIAAKYGYKEFTSSDDAEEVEKTAAA